jgi:hypothetical protein
MSSATSLVYVVVEVMSGVAVGAACFESDAAAERHAAALRKERDPNDDDVQVFECALGTSPTGG